MIFLDGFGLGDREEYNPYYSAHTRFLDEVMGGHLMFADCGQVATKQARLIPTDACLGVPGLPQSATGQTTLWTGVNAARSLGRHLAAYPNAALREILKQSSLFRVLGEVGFRATFANAYRPEYFEAVRAKKSRWSTSSQAVMSGGQSFRTVDDLKEGRAVYHDFSNKMLIELGHQVDIISPEQAGLNLANLALNHDFTLYEYFITDRIGHRGDIQQGIEVLEVLDSFIGAAANVLNARDLLIVASDHGNFENMSIKGHTCNRVPTLLIGFNLPEKIPISSLVDIMPFIYQYMGLTGGLG